MYIRAAGTNLYECSDYSGPIFLSTARWSQINHKKKVHPKFLQNLFFHIPIDMFSGKKNFSAIESTTEFFLGSFSMKKHQKGETLWRLGPPQRHSSKSGPFFGNKSATTTPQTMSLRADNICQYYLWPLNAFEGVPIAQEFLLSNAFSCQNFPKKFLQWILWQKFFFCLKTYLLGYGKADFEGILGVPFFYG